MKVIIDTNSLLSLVRYYIKIDSKNILSKYIKSKLESGELLIIDKVYDECKYVSKGDILSTLNYLNDNYFLKSINFPIKTDNLLAPAPNKLLRQIDNQFVNSVVLKQKKISEIEYEIQKNIFMNGADIKQIILALNYKRDNIDVIIVTEESEISNDNKLFKKIPSMCKELNIKTMTLPELLVSFNDLRIEFTNL